ncbi:MAG: hypothetical protein P4L49_15290 [Desulfosporosinus sp.]|nr:hypothetical protein [Desulfosporosinus sp.]
MAYQSRTTITPLLLTYENESMYLHIDPLQGCALFNEDSPEPFYRIQEPLLLAHGIMTNSKTVHLVVLKTSGELCYTLISGTSTPQTTLIAKLDVRVTIFRRLFLFPQGKLIHIFYAYSHQAIRDLWRIEHRFWNGSSWHSAHMGEVVHQQEPLYHVNLDSQGNLHLLTITFQGRYSLLFTNRFNGTFHIWGSPTETLKISGDVVDMAALMTSDNVHHLFWAVRTSNGQYELRWAQQTDAHELASAWHPSPAPIKTFPSPWKNIGALEKNGVLWLLAHTEDEILMQNDGKGWKLISSQTSFHMPLQWVHKGKQNYYQTFWLEEQFEKRNPAYYHELGFAKKQATPLPASCQSSSSQTPPPVPAFYPELISPTTYPPQPVSILENQSNSLSPSEMIELEEIATQVPSTNEISIATPPLKVLDLKENSELQRLVSSVAHLEQENTNMSFILQNTLSKFDQVLEAVSKNVIQPKRKDYFAASNEVVAEDPFEELEPVKEAMANLEKETESLSQVLRVMLTKQEENDSSLENLVIQVSQLQEEKNDVKNKGGFWNKWIT